MFAPWRPLEGSCLTLASAERAPKDADPAGGTSPGQDAFLQSALPRSDAPRLRPPAPMKPPPMKPRTDKARRKVAGHRGHVLARRVCLDAVVCGWSGPEPELLLRAAGLRWAALVLRIHHRSATAGPRRDDVCSGLGLVVAEDAVFDRRSSAGRRRLSAARTVGDQVPRAQPGPGQEPVLTVYPPTRPDVAGVWCYLMSWGWARGGRRRELWGGGCDVTEPPHLTVNTTKISPQDVFTSAASHRFGLTAFGFYFRFGPLRVIRKR